MRVVVFAQVGTVNRRRTTSVARACSNGTRLCTTAVESHGTDPFVKATGKGWTPRHRSFEPIFVHGRFWANALVRAGFGGKAPGCPQACAQGVHNTVACPPHEVPGYPHGLWITCSSWVAAPSDRAYVDPRCHRAGRRGTADRELWVAAPTVRTCMLLVPVVGRTKGDEA